MIRKKHIIITTDTFEWKIQCSFFPLRLIHSTFSDFFWPLTDHLYELGECTSNNSRYVKTTLANPDGSSITESTFGCDFFLLLEGGLNQILMPGDSIIHRHWVGTLCISKDYSQHQQSRKEDIAVSWCVMIQNRQDAAFKRSVSLIPATPEQVWGGKAVSVASSNNH